MTLPLRPERRAWLAAALSALACGEARAATCCRISVLSDQAAPPVRGTIGVVWQGGGKVSLTLAAAIGAASGPYAVLIGVARRVAAADVWPADPAGFDRLLALTAPVLREQPDADPCFGHRPAPPPAIRADDFLAPPVRAVEIARFDGADPRLRPWLARHGVHATAAGLAAIGGSAGVIALAPRSFAPEAATLAPVTFRYEPGDGAIALAGPVWQMIAIGAGFSGRGARLAPPDAGDLPEFIGGQFGHFFEAMLLHRAAGGGGYVVYAGPGGPAADLAAFEDGGAGGPAGAQTVMRVALGGAGVALALDMAAVATPMRAVFTTRIAWKGQYTLACGAGFDYRRAIIGRWRAENATLASLTGWRSDAIRQAMVADWQRKSSTPGE